MFTIPCIDCGNEVRYASYSDMIRRRKTDLCRRCYLIDLKANGLPKLWKKRVLRTIKSGEKSYNWKGGISYHNGYRMIRVVNHPFAKGNGYIFEHRLVMEKHIGRYLKPKEVIHHLNSIKTDNRIENLIITNASEHSHKYDAKRPPKRLHCMLCSEKPIGRGFCKKHYWTEFLKAHRAEKKMLWHQLSVPAHN